MSIYSPRLSIRLGEYHAVLRRIWQLPSIMGQSASTKRKNGIFTPRQRLNPRLRTITAQLP